MSFLLIYYRVEKREDNCTENRMIVVWVAPNKWLCQINSSVQMIQRTGFTATESIEMLVLMMIWCEPNNL